MISCMLSAASEYQSVRRPLAFDIPIQAGDHDDANSEEYSFEGQAGDDWRRPVKEIMPDQYNTTNPSQCWQSAAVMKSEIISKNPLRVATAKIK